MSLFVVHVLNTLVNMQVVASDDSYESVYT